MNRKGIANRTIGTKLSFSYTHIYTHTFSLSLSLEFLAKIESIKESTLGGSRSARYPVSQLDKVLDLCY